MEVAQGYHLIEVPRAGIKLDLPRELAYCSEHQYREMSELLYKYQTDKITLEQFRYTAIYRLLNLKKSKNNGDEQQQYEANIYQISLLIDTFFDRKEHNGKDHLHIRQEYVHNPLPTTYTGYTTLYGPEDYFSDVTFGQYVDGLNHLGSYVQDQDIEHLYALHATFYQHKRDKKAERYNKKKLKKRISLSQKAYLGDIYGFFLLFASFQNYLTTASVTWEGKELDLSILYQTQQTGFTSKIPGLGMKSMTYVLAETSVFGKLDEVEQTNMWETILRMYDIKKRDLDELARSEKAKK